MYWEVPLLLAAGFSAMAIQVLPLSATALIQRRNAQVPLVASSTGRDGLAELSTQAQDPQRSRGHARILRRSGGYEAYLRKLQQQKKAKNSKPLKSVDLLGKSPRDSDKEWQSIQTNGIEKGLIEDEIEIYRQCVQKYIEGFGLTLVIHNACFKVAKGTLGSPTATKNEIADGKSMRKADCVSLMEQAFPSPTLKIRETIMASCRSWARGEYKTIDVVFNLLENQKRRSDDWFRRRNANLNKNRLSASLHRIPNQVVSSFTRAIFPSTSRGAGAERPRAAPLLKPGPLFRAVP